MKQGTISVFFGCHSVMHSALVLLSWRKLYGRWPSLWQVCCIFLHDIGHFGLDYLDDHEQKKRHWELGAVVARRLFGEKGWELTAGHCSHSRRPQSDLYRADKYSWYIAPTWWLWWNNVAEPKLTTNCESNMDAVRKFRDMVKQSIESGEYVSTHSMYLSRVSGEEKQI